MFLRKIVPGSTDDSYGIEVARLAGVPSEVINRARQILADVEAKTRAAQMTDINADDSPSPMDIDDCMNDAVLDDIRAVDLNSMSPIEALNLLHSLQQRLR